MYMSFDNKIVGRVIREVRNSKKLSQETLSGLSGMARTHLSMIETGDKQPNFETIWKVAEALDLKPSQLVKMIEDEISKK